MKGIILAGGAGTRLYPLSSVVGKQLLPVYDKPMIYYPLATIMTAGIKDILIISDPLNLPRLEGLLGDGKKLGINLAYKVQHRPEGIAQAFVIGKEFIGNDTVCLILGDNIFFGGDLKRVLKAGTNLKEGGLIFGYWVSDPHRYGVIELDKSNRVISIKEKPKKPASNYVIPGIYFYDNQVISFAEELQPSARGEYEITDINNLYLSKGKLRVEILGRGTTWLDMGTHESLLEAANFIATIEKRQGLKIGCIEETAFLKKYITPEQFEILIETIPENSYRQYLHFVYNSWKNSI